MVYKEEVPKIQRGTESKHIENGKGVVHWVHIVVSTGDGRINLRDGTDVSGEILIGIERDAGQPQMTRFAPPLPFSSGLFLERVDHIDDWTIAFDHRD